MYQEEKDKREVERYKKVVKYVVYEDMEKSKPKETAVAAFKHKPYGMDLKEGNIDNGKEK